ncbi:MAG: hypothetical protein OXT67_12430 [Zetaproteobacteria bacterium]|nr:hypothetical protein [Zetaproteobacteria bacterium]
MSKQLSDHDFFFTYIHHYFNDELSPEERVRFEDLLNQQEYATEAREMKKKRGFLQIQLQSVALSEGEKATLRDVAIDRQTIDAVEDAEISDVSTSIDRHNFVVKLLFTSVILAIAGVIAYPILMNKSPRLVDPLNIIAYEALAFEQDGRGDRIYFPSDNNEDILKYFSQSRELDFTPRVIDTLPEGLKPTGASVIDYEVAKLGVAVYSKSETEKIFLFTFYGEAKELALGKSVTYNNRQYFVLASDRVNLVVWQDSATTIGTLVGRESMEDMLSLAQSGLKF